jgi:O-antigen/teichoic acid export membrane protein
MLKQASIYLIAHGSSALLGLLSVVLFTRLLSPAEYGIYIVGMGVAGIVSALLFTWVRLSILRFESEGGSVDIRRTALHAYRLSLLAAPLAVILTVYATGQSFARALFPTFLAVALGLFEFNQEILRARQNSRAYLKAAILRAAATIGLSLALISAGLGGIGMMLGLAGAYALTALLFAPRVWERPVRPFDGEAFRQMVRFGVPMALSGAVFALSAALDRLIVSGYLGEAAAGVYGASADLVRQIIIFPAVAIASAVFPIAIRSFAESGREAVDAHLVKSLELLLSVVTPAVVGLAIVAPNVASLILGPEFHETAARLIPILVFAQLFQTISTQFVHVSFHLAKKPQLMAVQGAGNLAVNVVAMVVLVPRFHLVGAAWALVLAEGAGLVFGYLLGLRAHPLPLAPLPVLKVAGAVAAMVLATTYVEWHAPTRPIWNLTLTVATGIIVFAAVGFAVNLADVRSSLVGKARRAVFTLSKKERAARLAAGAN